MEIQNSIRLDCNAFEAMEYKRQLDRDGLIVNQDYEWRYQKAVYDEFAWTDSESSNVTFTFSNPALATFYQLKWS